MAGGIAGWALGYFAYETVAKPILAFSGKLAEFEHLRASMSGYWILAMLPDVGNCASPPIKLVTILPGVIHMNLATFVLAATVTRGARFFLLSYLLRRFGGEVGIFIEKRLGQITAVFLILAIAIALIGRFPAG